MTTSSLLKLVIVSVRLLMLSNVINTSSLSTREQSSKNSEPYIFRYDNYNLSESERHKRPHADREINLDHSASTLVDIGESTDKRVSFLNGLISRTQSSSELLSTFSPRNVSKPQVTVGHFPTNEDTDGEPSDPWKEETRATTSTWSSYKTRPDGTHDYFNLPENVAEYRVTLQDCVNRTSNIHASEGIVYGLDNDNSDGNDANDTQTVQSCRWQIIVPVGRHVILAADSLGDQGPCSSSFFLVIGPEQYELYFAYGTVSYWDIFRMQCQGRIGKSPVLFLPSNKALFEIRNNANFVGFNGMKDRSGLAVLPKFRVFFTSSPEPSWTQMFPVFTSRFSGYITSPGFDITRPHGPFLNATYTLNIPARHYLMISFPHFQLHRPSSSHMKMTVVYKHGVSKEKVKYADTNYIPPKIFGSAVRLMIQFVSHYDGFRAGEHSSGMNMSFSFHPPTRFPVFKHGLLQCHGSKYASFKQHVHCNMQPECFGGEDEGSHCPFSSGRCNGSVDAGEKCYISVESHTELSWEEARENCKSKGGDLAMMKTARELEAFWDIYRYGRNWKCAYVGLRMNRSTPLLMYRKVWSWVDGTSAFDVNVTTDFNDRTGLVVMAEDMLLKSFDASKTICSRFVCQVNYREGNQNFVDLPEVKFTPLANRNSSFHTEQLDLFSCLAGHLTHSFLPCYNESHCGALQIQTHCDLSVKEMSLLPDFKKEKPSTAPQENVAMFKCDNRRNTVPYTLTCNFIADCTDGSDETFCDHAKCHGTFGCDNGQCIPFSRRCDLYVDCWDGSDEEKCQLLLPDFNIFDSIYMYKPPAPTILDLLQDGVYSQTPINSSQPCPDAYFRCPSSQTSSNCLPVYLRCNDVSDCPAGEDEFECDSYTCPGLYRCLGSRACVHLHQVCDDVPQCPTQDDEWLCGATCPQGCVCQGLAFFCPQPFPARKYPLLRYVDASYSGTRLGDLAQNKYLVYVNLASCNLGNVERVILPNVRYLDLSYNVLTSVDLDVFFPLKNLKTLSLKGNPLTLVRDSLTSESSIQLQVIDLSYTELSLLSAIPFKRFYSLHTINVSFCKIEAIGEEGLRFIQSLSQLDMRGNPLTTYPRDVLKGMEHLRVVYVDDYKLCCPEMLPAGFQEDLCFAPQDEISSCDDLLRSNLYRAFLWLVCVISLAGNIGCFFIRNWLYKSQSISGFNVFVVNLSIADFLMGVYMAFIGAADHVYRGSYHRYEDDWTVSIPCTMAGFVSMLSNEVSTFTICLITLDRFVVLRFPFSHWKFGRKSATVASALTWVFGGLLTLAPLLVPHWQFYGQTGICVPLPVTRQDFHGQEYSFGVMIVFNFLLFLLIAGGQVSIYLSVQANAMSVDTSKKLQDMTIARRLITVAVSNFLCWFPIGLLGMLASGGVPVPGEVNVVLAIFVLPLNSALNPFLYTFNMMVEKRKKEAERRVLEWLDSTSSSSSTSTSTRARSVSRTAEHTQSTEDHAPDNKEKVLRLVHGALQSKLVSADQIRSFLSSIQTDAD